MHALVQQLPGVAPEQQHGESLDEVRRVAERPKAFITCAFRPPCASPSRETSFALCCGSDRCASVTFTLVSGRKSSYYFDSKQTTLDPEGAYLTAWCILDLVRREGIDATAIGGMTLGADPMVCAVAPLSFLEEGPDAAGVHRAQGGQGARHAERGGREHRRRGRG